MFSKKEKGGSESLLFTLVAVFVTSLLMIVYLPSLNSLHAKSELEAIKRQYILYMEMDGCLTTENEVAFVSAVENVHGVESVEINSITQLERLGKRSKYSDPVKLQFNVIYSSHVYNIKTLFSIDSGDERMVIPFYAESTSKV